MRNSYKFRNSSRFDVQSSQASRAFLEDSKYIKIYRISYVMSEIQQETVSSSKSTQIVGFLKKAGRSANLFANSNNSYLKRATIRCTNSSLRKHLGSSALLPLPCLFHHLGTAHFRSRTGRFQSPDTPPYCSSGGSPCLRPMSSLDP
jgi:hypothetical protein